MRLPAHFAVFLGLLATLLSVLQADGQFASGHGDLPAAALRGPSLTDKKDKPTLNPTVTPTRSPSSAVGQVVCQTFDRTPYYSGAMSQTKGAVTVTIFTKYQAGRDWQVSSTGIITSIIVSSNGGTQDRTGQTLLNGLYGSDIIQAVICSGTPSATVAPSVQPNVAPSVTPTKQPFLATIPPTSAPFPETKKPNPGQGHGNGNGGNSGSSSGSSSGSDSSEDETTVAPTKTPTVAPSVAPSAHPSVTPSAVPSVAPSALPSAVPSVLPSAIPSVAPTEMPTFQNVTLLVFQVAIDIADMDTLDLTEADQFAIIDAAAQTMNVSSDYVFYLGTEALTEDRRRAQAQSGGTPPTPPGSAGGSTPPPGSAGGSTPPPRTPASGTVQLEARMPVPSSSATSGGSTAPPPPPQGGSQGSGSPPPPPPQGNTGGASGSGSTGQQPGPPPPIGAAMYDQATNSLAKGVDSGSFNTNLQMAANGNGAPSMGNAQIQGARPSDPTYKSAPPPQSVNRPTALPVRMPDQYASCMFAGEALSPNSCLRSRNMRFSMCLSLNGQLIIGDTLKPTTAFWTYGALSTPDSLEMSESGDLIAWADGAVAWSTGTAGANLFVVMQNDGNVVIYNTDMAVQWACASVGCTLSAPILPPPSAISNVCSNSPTAAPTVRPSVAPSATPTTSRPSAIPTVQPSAQPSVTPSQLPTVVPSVSPTAVPSVLPSVSPSAQPSVLPSVTPSAVPTVAPSANPTVVPTDAPTASPSQIPTVLPSAAPSAAPSQLPSVVPSVFPSVLPSIAPSQLPSVIPTVSPTVLPSVAPSQLPSVVPTVRPTVVPTIEPSLSPTRTPTTAPTLRPSYAAESCLYSGGSLGLNKCLTSPNMRYAMCFTNDGEVIIKDTVTGAQRWTNGASPPNPNHLEMQTNGALKVWGDVFSWWSSGTSGSNLFVAIQDDGNMIIYNQALVKQWSCTQESPACPVNTAKVVPVSIGDICGNRPTRTPTKAPVSRRLALRGAADE